MAAISSPAAPTRAPSEIELFTRRQVGQRCTGFASSWSTAGTMRESVERTLAARSGYSVFVCDRGDFAVGASSRSSRMLHCGLRYFEAENPVRTFAFHPRRLAQALVMARAGMQARREIALTASEGAVPFTMCFPVYPEGPVRGWHLDIGLRLLAGMSPSEPPLDRRKITRDFAAHLPFAGDLRTPDRLQSVSSVKQFVSKRTWAGEYCAGLSESVVVILLPSGW